MSNELHRKYRPKNYDEVMGQPDAIKILKTWQAKDSIPHAILFSGSSGTGKTSLARITARIVGAKKMDVIELDCANVGNVDTVRSIREKMSLSPVGGKARAYIIDEVGFLRRDPQAAMLKMLEEPPPHVYFMLCTTDPGKLLSTVRSRCSEVKTQLLNPKVSTELLRKVVKAEKAKLSESVFAKIIEVGYGSPRKMLVLLGQVISLKDEEEQLDCLSRADAEKHGIDIARCLFNPRSTFRDCADLLKLIEDEPETIRRIILSYATSVLLSSAKPFAARVINTFRDPYFDTGSGKALLVEGCYDLFRDRS